MNLSRSHIIAALRQEIAQIEQAIALLEGTGKRRGRPPKILTDVLGSTDAPAAPAKKKRGRTFSPAQRKAQAQRMKKMWAAKKAASA